MSDFNLKNTKTLSRELYKSDFYRYIPNSLATVNNNNSNITIIFLEKIVIYHYKIATF